MMFQKRFVHKNKHMGKIFRGALLFAFALASAGGWAEDALPTLPKLGIRMDDLTVSGLSSGGFMAVQFHIAHSKEVRGAAVLAAGPYYCAQGNAMRAISSCMSPGFLSPLPPLETLIDEVKKQAQFQKIDAPEHLAKSRVWIFSGGKDHTVAAKVVDALHAFYLNWLPAHNIQYERLPDAAHAMISPKAKEANACSVTAPPFISHCGGFDAPGRFFAHFFGTLPPAKAEGGEILPFHQGEFLEGNESMAEKGYVYIPSVCRKESCRLHVAFHGCRQGAETLGETYVREAGYNHWADAYRVVVLYPQAARRADNPNGCWDWWGYTGENYHLRQAPQIRAVQSMIDRLASEAGKL